MGDLRPYIQPPHSYHLFDLTFTTHPVESSSALPYLTSWIKAVVSDDSNSNGLDILVQTRVAIDCSIPCSNWLG